jgi:ABC-type phosphate transport system substrate-binding protein
MPSPILIFPEAVGAVALCYNIPGVTNTLNLTATVIAKIFTGVGLL